MNFISNIRVLIWGCFHIVDIASGMCYTVYNLGWVLSQTLAILVIDFTVPSAMVTKEIVGNDDFVNNQANDDLIRSIDSSFYFFIIFFAIALLFGLILLYQNQKETLNNNKKKEICIWNRTVINKSWWCTKAHWVWNFDG